MVLSDVELPLVRENHPATVYKTDDASSDEFATKVFRPQHVVPTVLSRPSITLGLPLGNRNWIHFRALLDVLKSHRATWRVITS